MNNLIHAAVERFGATVIQPAQALIAIVVVACGLGVFRGAVRPLKQGFWRDDIDPSPASHRKDKTPNRPPGRNGRSLLIGL